MIGELRVSLSEGVRQGRRLHTRRGVGFGSIIGTKSGIHKRLCSVEPFVNPRKVTSLIPGPVLGRGVGGIFGLLFWILIPIWVLMS